MHDICFVVAEQNLSGILDRIAHEVGRGFKDPTYYYMDGQLPPAERYFVTHYSLLTRIFQQVNPLDTPIISFFTHDKGNLQAFCYMFNMCRAVICESPEGLELLASKGVSRSLLHFVPEGGDNKMFQPHQRKSDGSILVCSTNYHDGRKNPSLVESIISMNPQWDFKVVGPYWKTTYMDTPYSEYPEIYSKCSVYLSCSLLEGGGPNSLIEAMHANIVPVVSDTGNARQYIIHGYNGFIFPHGSSPEHVTDLIKQAYSLRIADSMPYNDIWQTVRHFNWDTYSIQMGEIIRDDYSYTNSQELPYEDISSQA